VINGVVDARFRNLMEFEVRRARSFYDKGAPLVHMVDTVSRPGLLAMIGIYSALLDKIESRGYDIYGPRVSLSAKEKIAIAAKSMLRWHSNGRESALIAPHG
jgi:phytoene synthase